MSDVMAERSVSTAGFAYRTYAAGSGIASHAHVSPSLTIVLGGSYEEAIGGRFGMEARGSALVCPAGIPRKPG